MNSGRVVTSFADDVYVRLAARREREIAQARANVGKARQQLERKQRVLAQIETYWATYPVTR